MGHWDQTNAAFPFLQGIVDSAPFYAKTPASLVFVDSVADRAPHRASRGGVLAATETQFAVAEFS